MTRAEFAPIYAFAMKQQGQFETFTFILPVISTSQGDTTESPVVDGAVSIGASSATIDGLMQLQSQVLSKQVTFLNSVVIQKLIWLLLI